MQKDWAQNAESKFPQGAVCAVAVLFLFGFNFFFYNRFYEIEVMGRGVLLQSVLRQAFLIWAPLFLMLAGYLQSGEKIEIGYYLRILPVLGLYLLYSLGAVFVRHFVFGEIKGPREWIRLILSFRANEYSWFLEMYLGLLLFIPFLNALYLGLKGQREKLMLIGTALLLTAMPAFFNNFNIQLFPNWWVFAYPVAYYLLGAYMREYGPKYNKALIFTLWLLLTVGAGAINYLASRGGKFVEAAGGYGSVWTLGQAVLAFLLLYDLRPKNRAAFALLGIIPALALDIYLCSYLTDKTIYGLGQRLWSIGKSRLPLLAGGSFLLAVTAAAVRKAVAEQFRKRALLTAAALMAILAAAGGYVLKSETTIASIIRDNAARSLAAEAPREGAGPDDVIEEAGEGSAKIVRAPGMARLINYADGYQMDFPPDSRFNFDYAPLYTKVDVGGARVIVSAERSPYEDVDEYISYYLNRFITNEDYRRENGITTLQDDVVRLGDNDVRMISVKLENAGEAEYDMYRFATVNTPTRDFYRVLIKYKSENENFKEESDKILSSLKLFKRQENAKFNLNFYPDLPEGWSDETRALYDEIASSNEIKWGIFTKDIYGKGFTETIPALEEALEYKFPITLAYLQLGEEFPIDFMRQNHEKGKIVELTYQMTSSNNEKLTGHTPCLDVYRGLLDEEIRAFARGAREFGHPFLFRLNNEMNSDWTSYSGVLTLSDPDIYISNWRRVYRIFEEEGVSNAIWIFNPNDRNYPPCKWNHFAAYYPGNDYVYMLGITGYNTGTYYKNEFGEEWREFEEIYDGIAQNYGPLFSEFPWIITEFSSSSIGGDKVRWIENMFSVIHKYPEIKAAVWFSYADYDPRPERKGTVSRPYWLDETPETLAAFRKGLKGMRK